MVDGMAAGMMISAPLLPLGSWGGVESWSTIMHGPHDTQTSKKRDGLLAGRTRRKKQRSGQTSDQAAEVA
jgi:hypothetical protein